MNIPQEIEIALKENHYFSNAKYNGKIIAYCKTGMNKVYVYIDDYGRVLSLPAKVAFNYHIFVVPEFRRQNIADTVFVKLMHELRDRGYKKLGGLVSP